ncbi:MAG TPA: choice-of-anchor R domain-containing protein [Candidatus Paceibacterota bacterium]|nr:choice-of-anchor R domain-containing protein [Candidatus Paceibacterota bacterium]
MAERFIAHLRANRGAALLISIMFFFGISIAILMSGTGSVMTELASYRTLSKSKFSYVASEAAVEDALYRVANNRQISANEIYVLNGATSTLAMTLLSGTEREFYTIGDASGRIRKVYMRATNTGGGSINLNYAVQVGEGGVEVENNASVTGNIHSGGPLNGESNTVVNGNVTISSGITEGYASSTVCTGGGSGDVEMGRTNPYIDHAQQFIPTTSDTLAKVSLYIKRTSNPSSPTIRIVTDNAGSPSTTQVGSQAFNYSLADTNYGWVDVVFDTPPALTAGTPYWIVFDAGQHGSKYWHWCKNTADAYSDGSPKYKQDWSSGSGSWTAIVGDLTFKTFFGNVIAASLIQDMTVNGIAKADTITDSTINGDAYYQTITNTTITGTAYPGSPTPPEVEPPVSSTTIQMWIDEATLGGTLTGDFSLINGATSTLGPRKLDGDILVDNNAILTVSGTLYVTGTVDFSNNAIVQCHPTYSVNSCVIVADQSIDVMNNVTLQGSGVSGSYLILLTNSNCDSTTGSECSSSNTAVRISNNASGGAVVLAPNGAIQMDNNASMPAVVGYKVELENNAFINYNADLANINVLSSATSTPGTVGAWQVNAWREI